MKEKLVLIGNGMAGVRTLEELLKIAPDKYDITVFGAEPYGNYNRILLSAIDPLLKYGEDKNRCRRLCCILFKGFSTSKKLDF